MPRVFTIASVVVHAMVIAGLLVAQVLAVGALPTPRQPLTFEGTLVRLADIRLPAPPRRESRASAPTVATGPEAAPIEAPEGVRHETGNEGGPAMPADAIGVEQGIGSRAGAGTIERVPPPPPQPAQAQAPVRLHSGIVTPRKIVHVDPVYPRAAQAARVEGVVILEAVIDPRGAVASVRVLRSVPLLDQAALDAVRQWTYTPTLINGVPVPIVLAVTVRFTLQER